MLCRAAALDDSDFISAATSTSLSGDWPWVPFDGPGVACWSMVTTVGVLLELRSTSPMRELQLIYGHVYS